MTERPVRRKWNPWPYAIIGWFVLFTALCVGFVIKSLGVNDGLVTSDYYNKGLDHDRRMAAIARARKLVNPPEIHIDAAKERMVVVIPEDARGAVLELYRPSDETLDRKYQLRDGTASELSLLDLHPGLWEARISWETEGLDFFHKERVFVP